MSEIDLVRARLIPYDHQRVGIEALVKLEDHPIGRIFPGCFALFDEMGAGKTKQVIDAAQVLFESNEIDRLLVIAPASVRTVWYDPELGELKKHLWDGLPARIQEYHSRIRTWEQFVEESSARTLHVIVTNYEFLRSEKRFEKIKPFCNQRTLLVLDEASAVKNHRAEQTKACMKLRKQVERIVLLNGTPIANSPLDLYSQGLLMDRRILNVTSYFHFQARYAIKGGFLNKQILGWRDLDDLQKRMAPYVLRRLKTDCLDLPNKLPATSVYVPLDEKTTWPLYKDMRDQMLTWLDAQTVAIAPQAGVKIMRLAQICSGFVGGLQDADPEEFIGVVEDDPDRPDWLPYDDPVTFGKRIDRSSSRTTTKTDDLFEGETTTREVGREKLDAFLAWYADRLAEDPNLKLLVWCRFRPEVARLYDEAIKVSSRIDGGLIWGGQKKKERQDALRLLDPRTCPNGPVIVIGTPASGSMGLNLSAAHTVIYVSNDFSLKTRLQSEDRVHRPGQVHHVSYTDMIATGPNGQKTVDHTVIKALREKENLANWTCLAWIKALKEEE